MRLAYALLAEAAQFTGDGRLWLLGGGLDRAIAPGFPYTQPSMSVVVSALLPREDIRETYQVQLRVEDPSGGQVFESVPTALSYVDDSKIPQLPPRLSFAITLNGMRFSMEGLYAFRALVNNEEVALLTFYVQPVAAQEHTKSGNT